MGIFYIFFTLFPCVIGQLQERWVRYVARKWSTQDATVAEQTLTGGWAPTIEIRYQFDVNGESHAGEFQRRYQNKNSAGNAPIYEPGARIEILVDPKNPERSYFPLPLSMWGLLYSAPIAALTILAVFGGLYSGLERRLIEAKHRIPESEWKTVRYSRDFNIRFPGDPVHEAGTSYQMAIDSNIPVFFSYLARRERYSFVAAIYEYPLPPAPGRVFDLVRNLHFIGYPQPPIAEQPLVYANLRASLKTGRQVRWPKSTGRLFEYSQPDAAVEVYVSGNDVYMISTNWYVQSDVREFFDSMEPAGRLK